MEGGPIHPTASLQEQITAELPDTALTERPALQESRAYPVLTVPLETISEIFEKSLPIYPEFPSMDELSSPLLLCQICRQWRRVALSTPTLWRAIELDITSTGNRLELLDSWLSRSGDCPLSLSLAGSDSNSIADVTSAGFLQAAVLHCRRWEYITILMPLKHMHLIHGDMPLLRQLTFGPTELLSESDEPPAALMLFDRAPQLYHVSLRSVAIWP
jgi:hypothetical protein